MRAFELDKFGRIYFFAAGKLLPRGRWIMWKDIVNYFTDFDGLTNSCRTVALWVALALVAAFIGCKAYAAVYVRRRVVDEKTAAAIESAVNGGWIVAALVASAATIIAFVCCYFVEMSRGNDALTPLLFYPLAVFIFVVWESAVALFVKPVKAVKIVCAAVSGCALIAVVACMAVHYASGEAGKAYSDVGLYISSVAVVAVIAAIAFIADRGKSVLDTRTVTYAAVCVALSFALSYVRIIRMPMGGSITLASMLPLMLFSLMFGSRRGVLVGLVYGALQAVQDPWIVHPAQFVLDYAAAFAAIGLTGCIRDFGLFKGNVRAQFALGALVACALRFVSHYFAGVFAFGMYGAVFAADYGMPALANAYFYSFVYQCMYLLPELTIVLVAGVAALSSRSFARQVDMFSRPADKGSRTSCAAEPAPEVEGSLLRENIERILSDGKRASDGEGSLLSEKVDSISSDGGGASAPETEESMLRENIKRILTDGESASDEV